MEIAKKKLEKYEKMANETVTSFPPKLLELHQNIIERAIKSKKVDWNKIQASILYLMKFQDRARNVNREFAKTIRSGIRAGKFDVSLFSQELQDLHLAMEKLERILGQIISRRKKELGR